jgi:hypothetical protein
MTPWIKLHPTPPTSPSLPLSGGGSVGVPHQILPLIPLIPPPQTPHYTAPIHPRSGGLQATVAGWAGRMSKPLMRVRCRVGALRALGRLLRHGQKTGRPGTRDRPTSTKPRGESRSGVRRTMTTAMQAAFPPARNPPLRHPRLWKSHCSCMAAANAPVRPRKGRPALVVSSMIQPIAAASACGPRGWDHAQRGSIPDVPAQYCHHRPR